ncbi:MAG: class I SAM-dependent rRNA methyltransferase [Pirellulaceae bacterium]
MSDSTVTLKPRRAAPFFGRHPWVLDSAVASVSPNTAPGDLVRLCAENGDFIAWGSYNPASRIRVRLYSWKEEIRPDDAWLENRIDRAIALRGLLGLLGEHQACRLINSEADGLSGLIVDRFHDHLTIQPTGLGMWRRLDAIAAILQRKLEPAAIVVDLDAQVAKRESIEAPVIPSWGTVSSSPLTIREHGIEYAIDLARGQKTGFYLDQRENRRAVAGYLAGRRVADVCCYTGGFALCAEKLGNAAEVIGVDVSQTAVAAATHHAQLNGCQRTRFETADCFAWLDAAVSKEQKFGAVILDPPKFASGRKQIPTALRAYHRLNLQAIRLLEPGGILVTCSCTGSLLREEFVEMLHGVAVRSQRSVQVLEQRSAAADHPVGTHCRENEYLKCLICRVE